MVRVPAATAGPGQTCAALPIPACCPRFSSSVPGCSGWQRPTTPHARTPARRWAWPPPGCSPPPSSPVPWPRLAPGHAARTREAGRGGLPARLLPLALYCPDWPDRWHHYVLSRAGHAVGDLHPVELPDKRIGRWLTPAETSLLAGEQARRVLVRAAVLDPYSPAWPVTRANADALASGLTAPVPPFPPREPRGLARIWGVPEADLGVTALDRGFDSPVSALRFASSGMRN